MSDIQNPYTPPAEPAADAVATPPVETAPAAPEAPADYSAHPVWGKAVEQVPEMLRGPIYEAIKTSEREAQSAIEKARGTDIPQDWRDLVAEAAELGVTVDQLSEAYRGQALLAEQLQNDPDAFLAEMQQQVDHLISTGQITRRQGAQAMQQANAAAAEQTDDLLTPEQRELKEIKAWKEQQEAAQRADAERRRQEDAQRAADAQQEQLAEQYFDEFDRQMEAAGFATRDAAGKLTAAIPIAVFQQIGRVGGELIDANPRMTPQQAITTAINQVRQLVEATGGKLAPTGQQQAPQVPVIAGSSAIPGQAAPAAGSRSMEDRANAALQEALRLAGAGS